MNNQPILKVFRFSTTVDKWTKRVSYVLGYDNAPPANYKEGTIIFQTTGSSRRNPDGLYVVPGEGQWIAEHGYTQDKVQNANSYHATIGELVINAAKVSA